MGKRSDFAQKLLDDLRLRKEIMGAGQSSNGSTSMAGEYAANHPAGRIGKSLILKVKDVMQEGEDLPVCKEGDLIVTLIGGLTKACGCLLVRDEEHRLIGTLTGGDFSRALDRGIFFKATVGEMCNRSPRTVSPEAMTVEAMEKMESPPSPLPFLPVINDENFLIGIVTRDGLVSAGL